MGRPTAALSGCPIAHPTAQGSGVRRGGADRPPKGAPASDVAPAPRSVRLEPEERAAGAEPACAVAVLASAPLGIALRGLAHGMGAARIAPVRGRVVAAASATARAGTSGRRGSGAAASPSAGAASRSAAAALRTAGAACVSEEPLSAPLARTVLVSAVVLSEVVLSEVGVNGVVVNGGAASVQVGLSAGARPRRGASRAPAAPIARPGPGCRCGCKRAVPAWSPAPSPPRPRRWRARAMRRQLPRT